VLQFEFLCVAIAVSVALALLPLWLAAALTALLFGSIVSTSDTPAVNDNSALRRIFG